MHPRAQTNGLVIYGAVDSVATVGAVGRFLGVGVQLHLTVEPLDPCGPGSGRYATVPRDGSDEFYDEENRIIDKKLSDNLLNK